MVQSPRRTGSPIVVAMLAAAAVVVLQALLVPLFAAPAAHLTPRDLPIAVAGPATAAEALVARLAAAQPGAFDPRTLTDPAEADRALRDREVYGAFVVGPDGITLHTASGASPTVTALLTEVARAAGGPVRVVDVVPADPDDPRGTGFAAGFLPLGMVGMLAGVLLALLVASRVARLVGLLAFGVLAGLAGAAVLQGWLGVLSGGYLANAAAIGLFALAVSATMTGLAALFGRPGIALGAVTIFLVGNSLGAVATAPELLPRPWGAVGQWLPVGAGADLLRSTAFFDGAGATAPLAILAGYAVVGLSFVSIGRAVIAITERIPANTDKSRILSTSVG
ncbi:hypothetical protein BDK92_2944 [Micromonospora pisi]|uniref:ABC transporter permease n=1 Tax=Micromonospora pisi TaxID=589240 RepID=A0A495JHY1_9ACTN|nr:hypothetical protein [Micromonospora pisi]RKR88616.1 hypothetical protein BDK92_2944 [Micromonospora pisi]